MADKNRFLALGLGFGTITLAADQLSKWAVLEVLRLQDVGQQLISPIFNLTFVRNYGVSFGLLKAGSMTERWGLMALSGMIALIFLWWMRAAERKLTAAALGLVVGGAIGNMIDRAQYGFVVDFLDFSGLYFPWVFNVADAAITVGACLLVLDYFVHGDAHDKAAKKPAADVQ